MHVLCYHTGVIQLKVIFSALIPLILFTFLFFPFIDTPVCWDAGAEFSMVTTFFTRGLRDYSMINFTHPPFKPFLVSIFFTVAGFSTSVYNAVGLVSGWLGIIAMYLLAKSIFNKNVALTASLLLSTFPLFLANGINNLNDFLLTNLILVALYFYAQNNFFLYIVVVSAAVLTKETAIILPVSVLLIEFTIGIVQKQILKKNFFIRLILYMVPFFPLYMWVTYGQIIGRPQNWWALGKGAYIVVLQNVLTLNFFTGFAKAHITKLLFLNFNWVYWIIASIGIGALVKKLTLKKLKQRILDSEQKDKTIGIILLFCVGYILIVLTLQVPPTARYHLPLVPFLILATSFVLNRFSTKISLFTILFFSTLNFIGLFFSVDPMSVRLWQDEYMEGQHVYSRSIGDDELVYNLQYLIILKQRRNEILFQNKKTGGSPVNWWNSYYYTKHCSFRN